MENVCRFRKFYLFLALVALCLLYFQNAMIALSSTSRTKLKNLFHNAELGVVNISISENDTESEVRFTTTTTTTGRPTSYTTEEHLLATTPRTQKIKIFRIQNVTTVLPRHVKNPGGKKSNKTSVVLCPKVPPNLVGKMNINFNATGNLKLVDVERGLVDKPTGGRWKPRTCIARDRVAIIIPFRDRYTHLVQLLRYLIPMLQRQLLDFWIFVPEQLGNGTFNKGRLMNAAAREAMAVYDFRCIIFHDVDLIPEDDRNMYSCKNQPFHLSISIDQWKYVYMYNLLVGGVLNLRRDHLIAVNGYSNGYWGWGAEDDDMGYRILASNLSILRPPGIVGRYKSIPHIKRSATATQDKNNGKLLGRAAKRYKMKKLREHLRDGLNNVPYKLVKKVNYSLFTHLLIDVGTTSL